VELFKYQISTIRDNCLFLRVANLIIIEYGIAFLLTDPVIMSGLKKISMTTQEDIDKRMEKLFHHEDVTKVLAALPDRSFLVLNKQTKRFFPSYQTMISVII